MKRLTLNMEPNGPKPGLHPLVLTTNIFDQNLRIQLPIEIYRSEWDPVHHCILFHNGIPQRRKQLGFFQAQLDQCLSAGTQFLDALKVLEKTPRRQPPKAIEDSIPNFMRFAQDRIDSLNEQGRHRTAETYRSTMRRFLSYLDGEMIAISSINTQLIQNFEQYLFKDGITRNSSSFYMRILRTIYNAAINTLLLEDKKPFVTVYTGIDRTDKRSVSEQTIDRIRNAKKLPPDLELARDLFLFSFYTRGMAFVDLFNLSKEHLIDQKIIQYQRSKTGQVIRIQIIPEIQAIVDKYGNDERQKLFPLQICSSPSGAHCSALRSYNNDLKQLSKILDIQPGLTSYVARHSWASIAKNKGIAISVISECLGHSNETTTRIYLAGFNQSILDSANDLVINSFR